MVAIILPKTTVTMRNERSETSPHVCPRQGFLILDLYRPLIAPRGTPKVGTNDRRH